jgi:transposase-like protein
MKQPKQMTIREFFKIYSSDEVCLQHIFECRYGDFYPCPKCEKMPTWHRIKAERAYSCSRCGHHLHPTVGTPFEKSRTSLQLWFYVIFLFTTTRHGVSAKEIQRQTGVTYKCAWRMGHEIREHMDLVGGNEMLSGHVEIDETFMGGKTENNGKQGSRKGQKVIVLGMMERGGDVMTKVIPSVSNEDILDAVTENVETGSIVSSDSRHAYKQLPALGYQHGALKHSAEEFRNGAHCTNGIEGYWHILKASIASTHMHVSPQHLEKYLGEFEYRHNGRHNAAQMFPELISVYPEKA